MAMRLDKKVTGGEVKFVLGKHIGEVVGGQKVPAALIQEVLMSPPPGSNEARSNQSQARRERNEGSSSTAI
jgi:hypothetical protein